MTVGRACLFPPKREGIIGVDVVATTNASKVVRVGKVQFVQRALFAAAGGWALILLHGCGAILHGGRQDVTFDSKPPGATVRIGNELRFMTPHMISLPRSQEQRVLFEKEGYEPQQVTLARDFQAIPSILGNLLPLLPVGLAIDLATGAAWKLEPELVTVELVKKKKP